MPAKHPILTGACTRRPVRIRPTRAEPRTESNSDGHGEHRVITGGFDARKNDASIGSSRGVISADAHVSRTTARCGAHLVERRLAHHRMARHAHGRGGLLTTRFGSTFPHRPSPSRRILAPGHLLTTARLVVTPDHRRPLGWPSRRGRALAAAPRSIGDQQPSS